MEDEDAATATAHWLARVNQRRNELLQMDLTSDPALQKEWLEIVQARNEFYEEEFDSSDNVSMSRSSISSFRSSDELEGLRQRKKELEGMPDLVKHPKAQLELLRIQAVEEELGYSDTEASFDNRTPVVQEVASDDHESMNGSSADSDGGNISDIVCGTNSRENSTDGNMNIEQNNRVEFHEEEIVATSNVDSSLEQSIHDELIGHLEQQGGLIKELKDQIVESKQLQEAQIQQQKEDKVLKEKLLEEQQLLRKKQEQSTQMLQQQQELLQQQEEENRNRQRKPAPEIPPTSKASVNTKLGEIHSDLHRISTTFSLVRAVVLGIIIALGICVGMVILNEACECVQHDHCAYSSDIKHRLLQLIGMVACDGKYDQLYF